jgi:two-component system, LuxR family, response regulator FixJ
MRTLIFSSGEALLADLTQSQAVDCVVLDVKMPGMTGLEVQDYMKDAGWVIPVIFITAHEDQAAEAQALNNGAIGFLRKPFTEQDLMGFIHQALRQQGRDASR